jgi:hypothetical protein
MANTMTVQEALMRAEQIDRSLDAWVGTAPDVVTSLGGRDALARMSEMTCIGPVPRLDVATWARASQEREDRRLAASGSPWHSVQAHDPATEPVSVMPSVEEVGEGARRGWWQRLRSQPF